MEGRKVRKTMNGGGLDEREGAILQQRGLSRVRGCTGPGSGGGGREGRPWERAWEVSEERDPFQDC